jgi:hypothetical protein
MRQTIHHETIQHPLAIVFLGFGFQGCGTNPNRTYRADLIDDKVTTQSMTPSAMEMYALAKNVCFVFSRPMMPIGHFTELLLLVVHGPSPDNADD